VVIYSVIFSQTVAIYLDRLLSHGPTIIVGMIEFLIFVLSLPVLYYGARLLTDGARALAKAAGISEFVIGATVVAFGTSLPELASSALAMLSGHPGIVVGNVIGSNLANIGLALGFAGMLYPIYVSRQITDIDIPFLLASAAVNLVVFVDLSVSWFEGLILVLMYMAFLNHEISAHRNSRVKSEGTLHPRHLLSILVGAVMLYLGARYLISSALAISETLNISESVIAFLLIALGTSLPEIATSIVAARDGKGEIAIGNVLGSNAFNSLIILGSSSFLGTITVSSTFLYSTLPSMILVSVLLGFMSLNNRITRLEGTLLFLIYCALVINLL
jgi:cation:H+ antiporter